jgi:methenyltetrahydromethanopterin cyclohydrolase
MDARLGARSGAREYAMNTALSVNMRATKLVDSLVADAAVFRISVTEGSLGERLIDAGSRSPGGIAAGLRIAEICMGGLGHVALTPATATPNWPWTISTRSSDPVIACLASQYAGWKLSHSTGDSSFFALGSGPARALARREPLFEKLAYRDHANTGTLVLESAAAPPPSLVEKIAHDCRLAPPQLTIIFAPTQSLAGSTQVVARALEVALHKAVELGFPLERIIDGMAAAPLCPPHPDFVAAMGRTNDAIIYGGQAHLFVSGPAGDARHLAERLPSKGSRDYGRSFAELFESVNGDFYAIDPMLFSPAKVIVTAIETGESFHSGELNFGLLDASFS